jgi:hypothetical protein
VIGVVLLNSDQITLQDVPDLLRKLPEHGRLLLSLALGASSRRRLPGFGKTAPIGEEGGRWSIMVVLVLLVLLEHLGFGVRVEVFLRLGVGTPFAFEFGPHQLFCLFRVAQFVERGPQQSFEGGYLLRCVGKRPQFGQGVHFFNVDFPVGVPAGGCGDLPSQLATGHRWGSGIPELKSGGGGRL